MILLFTRAILPTEYDDILHELETGTAGPGIRYLLRRSGGREPSHETPVEIRQPGQYLLQVLLRGCNAQSSGEHRTELLSLFAFVELGVAIFICRFSFIIQ